MNRYARAIIGMMTFASPTVFLVFFQVAYANISGAIRWHVQPTLLFRQLLFAYIVWCGAMILCYLVHAWKTVPAKEKRFWLAALVLLNIFVAPLYWHWFIWGATEGSSRD